jgi:hypothetical protein
MHFEVPPYSYREVEYKEFIIKGVQDFLVEGMPIVKTG